MTEGGQCRMLAVFGNCGHLRGGLGRRFIEPLYTATR
jgi:hypothetical protein